MRFPLLVAVLLATCAACAGQNAPPAAPIDTYAIHADGGLVYTPLSREARRTGQLARYAAAPTSLRTVRIGQAALTVRVPTRARAYDVIPIPYRVQIPKSTPFPMAVEATAFEEPDRRKGRDLFDLALPGKLDLKVEYLGSITAHLRPGGRHNLKPDNTDSPGAYPPFERKPMVRSGVVESGDILWFRFRVTNTGDTILDPEGFGGWGLYPELLKKDSKGEYVHHSNHYNLYIRDRKYLYPGESHDFWIDFTSAGSLDSYHIEPGEYKVRFRSYHRYYRDWNDWMNMWEGAWMTIADLPITVEEQPRQAPVAPMTVSLTDGGQPDKLTRYIHSFEEFMTAFDCWQMAPVGSSTLSGTLYLQVAPWTKQVVLKFIGTGPVRCRTVAVPITVDLSTLAVNPKLHPGNCMVAGGRRVPVVYSQLMSDMRANIQVSPWPERYIVQDIRRMRECGINVCATTAMPWLYSDFSQPRENYPGDAMKYSLDVARRLGMKLEAWGSYPFDRSTVADVYKALTGESVKLDVYPTDGYFAVSHADPNIARANAAIWLYQFHRWGDAYAQFESGGIPFGTEDTRGWMRQDVHVRFPMGELTKNAFRDWLKARYGTVDGLNAAWGSQFVSFDAVDPESDSAANIFSHRCEYLNPARLFHDWSRPMADFDEFRTSLRVKNYRESLDLIRREVPQAVMFLRTEGGNAIVDGLGPADPNPHYRHAYYSQRRVAAEAGAIRRSRAFAYHSDYTTLPYTPAEVSRLTRMGVEQGVIPAWLPQFDNMRDIALNAKFGTDYQANFNADKPVRGAMMHVLTPVFPWFKAVSEAGGIPGITWEDYQCDGFATETQEREMLLYKAAMARYLATAEGKRSATQGVRAPDQSWRKRVTPKWSYRDLPATDAR